MILPKKACICRPFLVVMERKNLETGFRYRVNNTYKVANPVKAVVTVAMA
jgi:hypothetical protein